MIKYTETHEWIALEGEVGTIGVTLHAQKELGDIVYVELPKIGHEIKAGEPACVLESTKAAADVYSPVSGTLVEVNERLKEQPDLVNSSAEELGWLFKIRLKDPEELEKLMDKSAYDLISG